MAVKAFELYGDVKLNTGEVEKNLKSASAKLESFGKKAQNVGKKLSTFVTLPILGIGTAMVKLASDAEETNSKFDAVFKDQSSTVREWATTFSESVGRSTTANIGFLATIQDTLVPLGFMRDRAADMSKQVVALATDLASFNNLPTADVVRDIQSAIVGNTETLRKYGVVASQDAIIQEALTSGLIKNKNELDATSKAQAIYNLLIKGTVDAQGDAIRTADSTANRFRKLKAQTEDLLISFGQLLIPVVQDIVAELSKAVKWFTDLDESQKKIILTIAGLTAAIGPAVTALGTMSRVIGFIAANPLVAATAAVVALGVAIATIEKSKREAAFDELAEELRVFADEVGIAEENLGEFARKFDDVNAAFVEARFSKEFNTVNEVLTEVSRRTETTREQALLLLLQNKKISKELRAQLQSLYEQEQVRDKSLANVDFYNKLQGHGLELQKENARIADEKAQKEKDAADAIAKQNQLLREQVLGERKTAYEEYSEALDIVQAKENLGLLTYIEGTQQRADIQREYIEALIETGLTTEEQFNGHIDKLKELEAELKVEKKTENEVYKQFKANKEREKKILEGQVARQEEFNKKLQETQDQYVGIAQSIQGTVQPALEQLGVAIVRGQDVWKVLGKAAVEAIAGVVSGLGEQATIQSAIAFASGNVPAGIAYGAAATAAFIASGVIRALASYQEGGMIPGTNYGGDKVIVAANSGERILTAQQNAAYENFMKDRNAVTYNTTNNYGGSSNIENNIYLGDQLYQFINDGIENKKIRAVSW